MMGIGAVKGMAMAKLYLLDEDAPQIVKSPVDDPAKEYERFLSAREAAARQLELVKAAATESLGRENGDIFDYQLLMLEDTDFLGKVRCIIEGERVNCEYAVDIVSKQYIELFANIDNDYLRERTADIADLARRLNFILSGKEMKTLSGICEDAIVAAADISPSQAAGMNKAWVKGIALEHGGMSSHSIIIARSMGIPCVVGIPDLTKSIVHGETAIIDGNTGELILSPSPEQIYRFKAYETEALAEKQLLAGYISCRSLTLDGFEVKVYANITSENEAAALIENGGEGVGLFRTEFLYMAGSSPPSEALQLKVYSNTARILGKRPLIIRTLDAGGDKNIPYLEIPGEDNPFLGYRAIRYCLDHPEIFKTQVSAVLQAGLHGNVELMLPMITSIDELRQAKQLIGEVKKELSAKGIPHAGDMRLGMMVETPAAVFMADSFAREVDFFSIGTNDLTQYIFAADRMNRKVAVLNSPFQPALLKAVRQVCESAKRSGIEVDICGQAGEIPELVPLWVAMGIDNLSVSIPSIPRVRRQICGTSKAKAAQVMEYALSLDTAGEVENYLKSQFGI